MKNNLKINEERLEAINSFFGGKANPLVEGLLKVIEKHGGVEKIQRKAQESQKLENKLDKLKALKSPYLKDVQWLIEQRDKNAFVSMNDYRKKVLGPQFGKTKFDEKNAVTLEVSALQYFPWIITEAKQAIAKKELMPGRYIRVRNMKEQESDNGDTVAVAAAMDIIGATWVETLDTKGTDGSNVHLGGPATITGYFGGPGQPNDYPLKWIDEFLYYHTNFGVKQVLNVNQGTILLGYMLHKLGVDIEFKISVFMGNDNPYSVLWTLMGAHLFKRDDGSTPLVGFNFSNSVNNHTIEQCAKIRNHFDLAENVRFEHHITETWKSIVRQPYDRTEELVELAKKVTNISAKHEGGVPEVDGTREHPSDILDYFMAKSDALSTGAMAHLERNYLDKHDAVNRSARRLTETATAVVAAWNLHK